MNTSYETESELAAQVLPNGLLVMTKGELAFNDKKGKLWLVEATGTGITLGSGNVAVEQPGAVQNAADIAALAQRVTTAEGTIVTQGQSISTNSQSIVTLNTNKYDKTGGPLSGAATAPNFTAV